MAEKANHHFIPQFYLRGFGTGGEARKAKVFCVDTETSKTFSTLIRNIGSRRHFFRVELEGYDPNHVEDESAKIEGEISSHLSEVIRTESFPSDEHFTSIMLLMANMACRNPRFRGMNEGFHQKIAKMMMQSSLQTKDRWEELESQAKAEGAPLTDDVSYEDLKAFIDSEEYKIEIDQTYLVGMELKMVEPILEQLGSRNWCFVKAPENASYITSDDPVVLQWVDGKPTAYSPGFGLAGTCVMFSLSPTLALLGMFEELPTKLTHGRDQVAAFNTSVAKYATKQLYARDGEFELHTRTEQFVLGRDLVSALARERNRRGQA